MLLEWNERLNLTAERDRTRALRRHPVESLTALAHLPGAAGHLVDLGSGNGYPALALAACRPGLRVTLVEASTRKAAFLRAVLRETGRDGASVRTDHVARGEDLARYRPFDLFTCRAVARIGTWLPSLADCITPGGRALLFLGAAEADQAEDAGTAHALRVARHPLPTRPGSFLLVVDFPGLP
jgi:16S rRNA (guanine527-N7)-methyltransferase